MVDWYTPFVVGVVIGVLLALAFDELAGWRKH
jgi:hypothetical protein